MGMFDKYKRRSRLFALACWDRGRRAGAVIALGAAGALGFAPLGLWLFTLASLAGLAWGVWRARDWRRAMLIGWLWGVGHFCLGNNWIATAFTYQAKMPAWLGFVGVGGLALYLALYPALAAAVAWTLRGTGPARILGFAGAWVLSEMARGFVLTGFPWNPLAAALLGDFAHAGLAGIVLPWIGTYAASGLVAGCGAALAQGLLARKVWALAPVAVVAGGMLVPASPPQDGPVAYTLVQPNVAQIDLDEPSHYQQQFADSAALSTGPGGRLVLWPESGLHDYVREGYPAWAYQYTFAGDPWMARWRIARVIGRGSVLLGGTEELDIRGDEVVGGQNILAAIDGDGHLRGTYAKAHLVPFGEYLPARDWLKPLGIERLVPGDMDFRAGPGPRTLDLGALGKAGGQICYEIVFSGEVVDRTHRPDYLLAPSNDGWFGAWGPPQHLAQARLRAIEEGLPVLRSTTNGISAVVDAGGIVRGAIAANRAGRIDGHIPRARTPGLFARFGAMVPLCMGILLLGLAALVQRRRYR